MSATPIAIPPLLTALIGHLAAAVPARARTTFTELLVGTATTRGVTDAILAAGLTRSWTTYYWFLEYGRWAWLAVWRALPGILAALFAPTVWYVVIDDTVVERGSARLAGPPQPHRQAEPSCAARAGCAWPRWSSAAGRSARCR
jgi:DDE superfamily endonuclease